MNFIYNLDGGPEPSFTLSVRPNSTTGGQFMLEGKTGKYVHATIVDELTFSLKHNSESEYTNLSEGDYSLGSHLGMQVYDWKLETGDITEASLLKFSLSEI